MNGHRERQRMIAADGPSEGREGPPDLLDDKQGIWNPLGGSSVSPAEIARARPPVPQFNYFIHCAVDGRADRQVSVYRAEQGISALVSGPGVSSDFWYLNGRGQLLIIRGLRSNHDCVQATGLYRAALIGAFSPRKNGSTTVAVFPGGLPDSEVRRILSAALDITTGLG